MACKVLQVKHCGPIVVEGQEDILAALQDINATLQTEITVAPNDEWAAIFEAAVAAALADANVDVTITGPTPIIVQINTSAGPVEISGTVGIDGPISVDNFPTEIAINNFADLEGLELTVTLDGEVITVTPDQAFIDELDDIVDAIQSAVRVDWEATGMCVYNAGGEPVTPPVQQYNERRYSHLGLFLGSDVVLSQYNTDGTITGYTLGAGETVARCLEGETSIVTCPSEVVAVDTASLSGRDLTQEENDILPAANTVRNFLPWKPENVNTPPFPTGAFVDSGGGSAQTGGYNDGQPNAFRTRVFPLALEAPATCNGVEGDIAVDVTIAITGNHTVAGTGSDVFIYILSGPDNAPVIEDTLDFAGTSLIGSNSFTSSVTVGGATADTLRAVISLQTYETTKRLEFEVDFFAIAGEAEPCEYDAKIVHDPCALTLQKRIVEQNDTIIALLQSVIGDPNDPCPCEDEVANAFPIPDTAFATNTKFNLDDPTGINAYGDVGNDNWTAQQLADALNAQSANATGPTVPSNIDYSTTVWGFGNNGSVDYVFVESGPVPTSLDLVSQNVTIPVTAV